MQEKVLCYDMGGKRIRAAVATRGKLFPAVRAELPEKCRNAELSALAVELGQEALRKARTSEKDLLGIGYGAAGEWEGLVIRFSPNNPVRENISAPRDVGKHFGLLDRTHGANDLKAAVHAVPVYGHGKGKKLEILAAITYSDGNNIAILNRRRPYPGYGDLSQEVGHAHIEHGPGARWCGCGAQGCFEAYVSGTAAANMAVEALLANRTKLGEQPIFQVAKRRLEEKSGGAAPLAVEQVLLGVRAEHVYEALATCEDPVAQWVCETQKYYIAQQLAHVCLHHRPQLIELFGGLTHQRKLLFEPAIADLSAHPARYASENFQPPEIRVTALGDDIGLYGAASMVFLAKEAGAPK